MLNDRQRQAVEHVEGPLLIVAGPGSGKTRVITHRIAYLINTCGVNPYRIGAVTFTNKAAKEMRERLDELLGPKGKGLTASTFHSFCAMILRREGEHIGLDRDYAIYDDADTIALLKRAMKEVDVDPKQWGVRAIQSAISGSKSQLMGAAEFGKKKDNYFDEIVFRIFQRYESLLTQSTAVDFDDILLKSHHLLTRVPEVAAKYQQRFVHFMVDEFQDTNIAQYAIARNIAAAHNNLCVVGDPDQSIYSWRNADLRNILSFKRDFKGSTEIALEQNYRSTKTILEAAQKVIKPNEQRVEKELWTENGDGLPIVIAEGYDEQEEARKVLKEVQALTKSEGYKPGDIAVMFRVNAQSRALEEGCLRYGIPYQLIGGLRFYQRQEIKDVVAYLRLLANPHDDVSLNRVINVPNRGIGQRTLDELTRMARDADTSLWEQIGQLASNKENGVESPVAIATRSATALIAFRDMMLSIAEAAKDVDLVKKIDLVMARTGYRAYAEGMEKGEERGQNLDELRSTARDFVNVEVEETEDGEEGLSPLTVFLESVSLVADTDSLEDRGDAITLITLHQAKGLEYPVVFMVGMEEGLLPHLRSLDDENQMEEERRLCYVGMTRAQRRLYLLRAFKRGFRGSFEPNAPSRFLNDIPTKLIVAQGTGAKVRNKPAKTGEPERVGRDSRPRTVVTRLSERPERGPGRSPVRKRRVDATNGGPRISRTSRSGPMAAPRGVGPNAEAAAGADNYRTGDKVRHVKFGEGVVVSVKATPSDIEVTVAFKDGHGIKRLLMSFAPLERVN
jgi:DNA helicase II / ATP-dependent DNA helicase PcrA